MYCRRYPFLLHRTQVRCLLVGVLVVLTRNTCRAFCGSYGTYVSFRLFMACLYMLYINLPYFLLLLCCALLKDENKVKKKKKTRRMYVDHAESSSQLKPRLGAQHTMTVLTFGQIHSKRVHP